MRRVWFFGVLGIPTLAGAVDVDPFDPSGSIVHGSGTPAVDSPTLTGGGPSFGLFGVASEQLVTFNEADGSESVLVPHAFSSTLYGGYTFQDKLRLELQAPIYWHTRNLRDETFSGAAMGDLLLQANIRLRENESGTFGVSLLPAVGLPTGRAKALVARGPHLKLRGAVGGLVADRVGYAANLGFVLSPGTPFEDVAVGSTVVGGAGAWVFLDDHLRVGADYDLSVGTSNAPGFTNVLGTGHAFAQMINDDGIGLTVGAGRGFVQGVGSPDWRVMGAITWARIQKDTDDDGIVDDKDACPLDPEDIDTWEDLDGCPDDDNDEDTILDLDDLCPLAAEDFDDFEDLDGCPEEDNDEDGILDPEDACPVEPGPPELMGCPDSDGDGLVDALDLCPDDAGPAALTGCPDSDEDQVADYRDACPDTPRAEDEPPEQSNGCPSKAFVKGDRIQITERVLFESGSATIKPESHPLLDEVVGALQRYPQITTVEVAGHTDNKGSDAFNLRLSKRRAAAVLTYMTDAGIDAERLSSEGYGETEPIDSNFTESGRQRNRRVEFRITAQDAVEEVEVNLGADVGGLTVRMPQDKPYALLEVDGELMSPRAPVKGLIVTPGDHSVRVVDPRRGLDWSSDVSIAGGQTVLLEVPAAAMEDPDGAGPVPDVPVFTPDTVLPEDAPLAVPIDGEPAEGTPDGDDAAAPDDAATPDDATPESGPDDASLLPTADQPDAEPDDAPEGAPDDATLLPTADQPDADDAPEATPDDAGTPDNAIPAVDPTSPWGTTPAVDDDASLLPTADQPDADQPDADPGTPEGDPDSFPVDTDTPVQSGTIDDPWGMGGSEPEAAPSEVVPEPEPEEVVQGSGFGEAEDTTVSGPGFGAADVDPKEAKRLEKEARKAAKRAAKEARQRRKEEADEPPPPLVDPNTLPGAPVEGGDTGESGGGPSGDADDDRPQPTLDDPWGQGG